MASAIAVLAVVSVAGCGSSDQPKSEAFEPATVTSSPSPTPTASQDEAILAAYREFFARQTEISLASKDDRRALLEPFTTNPALQRVLGGMFAAEEIGEVGYGAPVVDPSVQSIDGDRATVRDCQDGRNAGRKKRADGKITTRGIKATKVVATLARGADGRWRMATIEYPEEAC
ncbi:MAG: hypothetical protein ACT4P1_11125 [Sporichthyaceae bacterium]